MPFTTQYLAEWIAGISPGDIPKTAKAAAKRCLLDLMGAAVAGHVTPLAEITRNVAQTLFAPGPCSIWFSSARRQAPGAALANSAAASALDIDDGNRAGGGHPGAAVIPSALAVASETGADGEELLTAMIIGYEIGVRISAARDFAKQVTLSTGRWCAYAAAAVGGRLYGMPPEQLAQAPGHRRDPVTGSGRRRLQCHRGQPCQRGHSLGHHDRAYRSHACPRRV